MERNMPRRIATADAEVARLFESGITPGELASRFGVSRAAIGQAIKRARENVLEDAEATAFREQFKRLNDLERKWRIGDLVNALGFDRGRAGRQVQNYFEWHGRKRVSICEVMDSLLPYPTGNTRQATEVMPALRFRCIGKIAYARMALAMNAADMGPAFKEEWHRRKLALRDLVATGKVAQLTRNLARAVCGQ
jgi:DNA-binding transcriptional ArsR family regulator